MRRYLLFAVIAVMLVAAFVFTGSSWHRIYLPTATGITAKQVCSLHFVSGLEPERARSLYIDPLLSPFDGLISARVHTEQREVRARLFGLYRQRAVFREGLGCSLVHDGRSFDRELALPASDGAVPMMLDAAHRDAVFDTGALRAAMDRAFEEPAEGGRNTLAAVVLHEGRLVAERYAEGIGPATPLHGWSMTKSVIATLAGAMVQRGEVMLDAPGILDAPGLESTTLEQLLRMTAGLDLVENQSGRDPNSDMLFTESDMAGWAARRPRLAPPGERFAYESGSTVLAARALQDRLGEELPTQIEALRERLFRPLEMHTAVMEVDERGTFQGSSYLYASATDWARLAQLYLDDGVRQGRRILPGYWDELVRAPTPGSTGGRNDPYGMGFWIVPEDRESVPGGAYFMNGFQGQSALIAPEQRLVVVRLGATHFTGSGAYRLLAQVIEAMR